MLEQDLLSWLGATTSLPTFYQHIDTKPPAAFIWVQRNGDNSLDCLDETGEPDEVFFDIEIYCQTSIDLQTKNRLLRLQRDYRGAIGTGWVDDIAIDDQRDDYEPQASADTLPPLLSAFRLTVSGYIPAS